MIELNAARHDIGPRRAMTLLLQQVSSETGVTCDQILGDQRHRFVVDARQRLMAECHLLGYSTAEIGRFIGRDHTTVMYALRKLGVIPTPVRD